MAPGWQSKLTRVCRMDWVEVRVRLEQAFHKRSDWFKYRLGVRNGSIQLNRDASAEIGNFFFLNTEVSERAQLLRKHLPDEAAEILREADGICAHRFRLLGYENLDYGDEIDWHLDVVHGKRAPLAPWFRIPFLDFAAVGDHKVTWELNRHQHLVTLAKAWLLGGEEKYVRELMAQWRSWVKANPYPLGINWASTLEVAFRALSWIWVDHLLAGESGAAELRAQIRSSICELRSKMLPALALHGRYIERYLSTYFSPNTHLLGEAVVLFFLGTLYPQMRCAARWKQTGWDIVLREAERQVRPDGVYFEQSLYYHVYALDFFLYARLLAARNGMEISPSYDAVLQRMLAVLAALAQAGPAEGFGDDDGGRLWNPRRNRTEHMTDPLILGALMYARKFSAARRTEEAIWLFGARAVEELAGGRATTEPRSIAFSDGGVYVMADSQPFEQVMMVDGGPQGVGRSGHGHADALSLRLTVNGRRWLVDSGSGVYIAKDAAERNRFRGAAAHNTMLVDGMDQAVAGEPFSWKQIPTTRTENWIAGKSFTYFVGSHNGYERLADPVVHRRHVLKIVGGPWLVRDVALGRAEHELEIRWHFAPDLEVRNEDQSSGWQLIDVARGGAAPDEPWLNVIVPEAKSWTTEVSETLLSPAYGAFQSAPLVRSHARVSLPAEILTALVPRSGTIRKENTRRDNPSFVRQNKTPIAGTAHAEVQAYQLDYDNECHRLIFASGDREWGLGPWSSDADVLYFRFEEEKLVHLVVIGGSNVVWKEQPLLKLDYLKTDRPKLEQASGGAFFEWRRQGALVNASPEEFSLTPLFEELTGDSRSLAEELLHNPVNRGSVNDGSANHDSSGRHSSSRDSSSHHSSKEGSLPYVEKR